MSFAAAVVVVKACNLVPRPAATSSEIAACGNQVERPSGR
jgi:hypothetical protein